MGVQLRQFTPQRLLTEFTCPVCLGLAYRFKHAGSIDSGSLAVLKVVVRTHHLSKSPQCQQFANKWKSMLAATTVDNEDI